MSEERSAAPAPAPVEAAVQQATAAEMPIAAAEPAYLAEPVAAAPVVHAEPAPVRSEPAPAPIPAIEVEKALQESGLVLIQTDPNKVKLVEPVAEPRFVPVQPRPRRAPPPDTGPLQIVETRKDS